LQAFESGVEYFTYSNKKDNEQENSSGFTKLEVTDGQEPSSNIIYFVLRDDVILPNEVFTYYEEKRLCTIGSDTMYAPCRAVNGKLNTKINGEITFTFTVYYRYFDNETGQLEYNPYLAYLTNERKVKLKYDGEWYDLIIK
jgi:hypothetical protein